MPSQKGPAGTSVGSTASSTVGDASDEGDEKSDDPTDAEGEGEVGPVESSSEGAPGDSSSEGESSSDDGSSSEEGGEPPSCPQEATCATATVIGAVSGDEDSEPIELSGAEPTWVTFQVTEDNDAVSGEAVSFSAFLDSPAGSDFDLFVYRGPSNGTTGCGGTAGQSTSVGSEDVVHMSWGEGGVANGGDDRAWVAVEIRPKADCDGVAEWTLTIVGDD